jgi:hypothetical protein
MSIIHESGNSIMIFDFVIFIIEYILFALGSLVNYINSTAPVQFLVDTTFNFSELVPEIMGYAFLWNDLVPVDTLFSLAFIVVSYEILVFGVKLFISIKGHLPFNLGGSS